MRGIGVAVILTRAVLAQNYPSFPVDWSAYAINLMVENEGGYTTPDALCCSSESYDCVIEVQFDEGMLYFDYTNTRVAQYSMDGTAIISLFAPSLMVECAVDADHNCQAFCQLDFPLTPYNMDGFTDAGPVVYNGSHLELWQDVSVFPILNITMETDNYYVNQTNFSNAYTVIEVDDLTPFGEFIGQFNTTYYNWTGGSQNASEFVVNGLDTCPEADDCDDSAARLRHRRMTGQRAAFYRSMARRAKSQRVKQYYRSRVEAEAAKLGVPVPTPAPLPVAVQHVIDTGEIPKPVSSSKSSAFPNMPLDWSAYQEDTVMISQGDDFVTKNAICCPLNSSGCELQLVYEAGMMYFDYSHNQTALLNPDTSGIVSLYIENMECEVDTSHNCVEYCRLDMDLTPYNVDGFTDMGPVVINGTKVEWWQFYEVIPIFNITMEIVNIFVNQSNPNNANPVVEYDQITPFGIPIATANTTFFSFKGGPQDPKNFVVNGLDTCPESPNCDDDARIRYRRKMGQYKQVIKSLLHRRA